MIQNKFETWLFYIFIFSIPISLRHIFHYEAFNFIEWTSVYIYATDIILIALWGFWFVNCKLKITRADWFLLAFLGIAALSIFNALDTQVAIFQWFKLAQGAILYFYIKDYALGRFDISRGFTALILGAVLQSVIAIVQFLNQGSVGLTYLGESPLAPAMTGIAAFYVEGIKIMRAYGTTPHANVLAAYLFLAIGAFYFGSIYSKKAWPAYVAYAVMLWALLLTFSRTIILFWAFGFSVRALLISTSPKFRADFWQKPEPRVRILRILGVTLATLALFSVIYWPHILSRIRVSSTEEAIQLRVLYNQQSLQADYNWLGVGIGNFVPWLMTRNLHLDRGLYQPVHNIYLLIYAETGILGIFTFLIFLALLWIQFYQRLKFVWLRHFSFALIIGSILAFGLFDHYLWTIQSGRLMFWLVLGFLAAAE